MFHFICGVLFGILLVILLAYLILFSPLNEEIPPLPFVQQFQALRFPKELKKFLETTKNTGSSESEKCFCISLLFHFLFQELKDTRRLRRWFHKRLQLELHDLTTRSTAGRLIQDIRIRDISVGSQFPVINSAKIESYQLSDDGEGFESLNFLIDLDYAGGFEASIDVFMVLGRFAQFSIHVSQLRGKARLFLTRQPFTHWAFAFVEVPQFNFKIDSQWQGRQIKHLIPLITQQIRRAVQRKLVWPNYKIRYRPFFPNPFFTPSLPIDAFSHIKTVGGLEVTILQCTRLNVSLAHPDHDKVYCSLSIDQKPFSHGRSSKDSRQSITVLIDFVRHDPLDPIGLTLSRSINELGARCVQISSVADESSASKSGFKPGDIILAVNNVPIRTERQANKLLCSTAGELGVLVERSLSDELNVTNHQIHHKVKEHRVNYSGDEFDEDDHEDEDVADKDDGGTANGQGVEHSSSLPASTNGSPSRIPCTFSVQTSDIMSPACEVRRTQSEKQFSDSTSDGEKCKDLELGAIEKCQIDGDERGISHSPVVFRSPSQTRNSAFSTPCITFEPSSSCSSLCGNKDKQSMDEYLDDRNSIISTDSVSMRSAEFSIGEQTTLKGPTPSMDSFSHESLLDTIDDSKDADRPSSRCGRIQAKAADLAAIGKARVSDLWHRKKEGSGSHIEMAAEALAINADNNPTPNPSPPIKKKVIASSRFRRTISGQPLRKRKGSPYGAEELATDVDDSSCSSAPTSPGSLWRNTKHVHLENNILLGQSLHFTLDEEKSRFLNVAVYSCSNSRNANETLSSQDMSKSSILGCTSIMVPQILDDCLLTLSNSHRELFVLKSPPNAVTSRTTSKSVSNASQHNGFDSRLCYGDILIGFRFFPSGFPQNIPCGAEENIIFNDEDTKKPEVEIWQEHKFDIVSVRYGAETCLVCHGKVWLKTASRCSRCSFLCHNRCTSKLHAENMGCTAEKGAENAKEVEDTVDRGRPDSSFLDDTFAVTQLAAALSSEVVSVPPAFEENEAFRPLTRRRRIANRISEKLSSTWYRVGKKRCAAPEDGSSTSANGTSDKNPVNADNARVEPTSVKSVIPDVFDLLGLKELAQIVYQPGNAYNEEMIRLAKSVGKNLYKDMETVDRKLKINEQMDKLQEIISQTTIERLNAISTNSTDLEGDSAFVVVDNRLQALAVLMLHLCAGLQDCIDHEESVLNGEEAAD